nr:pancreatic lipase-related protein 2 isoform X1 [Parasteatoda tepidariorum]XP_042906579.1 pancreatic lipase-related protein 2 isoform X2 [Parasteatoda tepidariorum]
MDPRLVSCFVLLLTAIVCQAKIIRNSKSDRNVFRRFAEEAREDDDPQCIVAEEQHPEFRYFTPKKLDGTIISNRHFTDFEAVIKSTINLEVQTVFILHGYLGGNAQWPIDIKNALIEKEKCNVFIVDWSGLDGKWYGTAMDNMRRVGEEVGVFIKRLKGLISGFDPKKVHIVGHSLGAHASGYAGKWVKDQGFKVGRITGLDPAGPDFNELTACQRLDRSDADFVDVIHTNWAGKFWGSVSGFGLEQQVGHFDFYPNGGEDQPGCKTAGQAELDIALDLYSYLVPAEVLRKIFAGGFDETKAKLMDLSCSHSRAYEYFYWSIKDKDNGCRFSADECASWEKYNKGECATPAEKLPKIQMGYYSYKYKQHIQQQRQWKFYLRSTSSAPYCEK